MADNIERLVERLTIEGQKTIEFFENLSSEQWLTPVYSEGVGWTIHDVLAHFVSAEAGHIAVIKNIIYGGSGSPADFNVHVFNNEKVGELSARSYEELIELFRGKRQASVEFVKQLTGSDLEKRGRHPFYSDGAVEDIIKLIYRHIQVHLRDVKRLLNPEN